ncbi:MAG: stage II sporulation protein R [Lachnospiraceae bacterium]
MTTKRYIFFSCSFLLLALLCFFAYVREEQETLATHLSPSILRFHILADSDRSEDQAVKLEVRSLIMDYLNRELGNESGKEDTIDYLTANSETIEQLANDYLAESGFSYGARLELTNCYFPMRAYGPLTFPAGYYDAARIILGSGEGHNWWCVLYPRFCFVDAVCSEVPKETLTELQKGLKQDDYLALQDSRPEVKIHFFLFPVLNP